MKLTVGIYFQEIIRESGLSFLNYKEIRMEIRNGKLVEDNLYSISL